MSGAYDPITPPSFAEAIAPGFSNGQVAVLPHAGHGVTGDECGAALAIGFFASPTDTIDTACIETSTEPTWIPASLAGLDYEEFELGFIGIRGVAPVGWTDQGFGTFVRSDTNLAHQTLLIQQGGPLPAQQFVDLLSAQLGGEPAPGGSLDDSRGRTWDIVDLDSPLSPLRIYSHNVDGFSLLVAVFGPEGDINEMQAEVLPTVLEAIEPA